MERPSPMRVRSNAAKIRSKYITLLLRSAKDMPIWLETMLNLALLIICIKLIISTPLLQELRYQHAIQVRSMAAPSARITTTMSSSVMSAMGKPAIRSAWMAERRLAQVLNLPTPALPMRPLTRKPVMCFSCMNQTEKSCFTKRRGSCRAIPSFITENCSICSTASLNLYVRKKEPGMSSVQTIRRLRWRGGEMPSLKAGTPVSIMFGFKAIPQNPPARLLRS